jgi:uncharacterized membrane protein
VILVISLAFNLAVAGAIVAHKVVGPHAHHRGGGPGFDYIMPRSFFFELDRDRRNELVDELRGHRDEFRTMRKGLREHARKLAAALRTEPFDAGAVSQALAAYEGSTNAMMARGRTIATDFYAKLTAEERKVLADEIEHRASRRHRHWRGWKRWRHHYGDD